MFSLIQDFAITLLIIILGHWIYGVADIVAYDFFVELVVSSKYLYLAIGIFASITVVVSAAVFEGLGFSQLTFGISKILARICQFIITILSILNIIFYASMATNFIRSIGYDIFVVIFLTLVSSCWASRMIDFNFHTKNTLLPVGLFAFMSVLLVEIVWPYFGF